MNRSSDGRDGRVGWRAAGCLRCAGLVFEGDGRAAFTFEALFRPKHSSGVFAYLFVVLRFRYLYGRGAGTTFRGVCRLVRRVGRSYRWFMRKGFSHRCHLCWVGELMRTFSVVF